MDGRPRMGLIDTDEPDVDMREFSNKFHALLREILAELNTSSDHIEF